MVMDPGTRSSYKLRPYGVQCKVDKPRKVEKRGRGRETEREQASCMLVGKRGSFL